MTLFYRRAFESNEIISGDTSVLPESSNSPNYYSPSPIITPYHDNPSVISIDSNAPLLYTSFDGIDDDDRCGSDDDEGYIKNKSSKHSAKKLWIVIGISLFFFCIELSGGFITGSLALLSDAFHLLSDVVSFAISLLSIYLARRPATKLHSYGFHRAEILGALTSIVLIWLLTVSLCVEAYDRIKNPKEIDGKKMCIVARVLISSIAIMIDQKNTWVDPLCTFLFSALVMATTFGIFKNAIRILMEATPSRIDAHAVQIDLESIEGVKSIHDLHIWDLTVGKTALTAHLRLHAYNPDERAEPYMPSVILSQARRLLRLKYKILSVTIQIDS
ncbi:3832_t:CDS:2 [Diversispora eburnea]|uniref:3832_t:CDS:1 n=1 Tax=Diversispora eburnea TaxID=1213867 RepID=A0A9N8YJH2_9GLOM|nr:3832_t:CDS:2 [Diversispora eburnea]